MFSEDFVPEEGTKEYEQLVERAKELPSSCMLHFPPPEEEAGKSGGRQSHSHGVLTRRRSQQDRTQCLEGAALLSNLLRVNITQSARLSIVIKTQLLDSACVGYDSFITTLKQMQVISTLTLIAAMCSYTSIL